MTVKSQPSSLLELPVAWGGLSIGDKSARVGCTIDRSSLALAKADKLLCERRLTATIIAKPSGWTPDEKPLPGMNGDSEVKGICDVKGISVSAKHIGCGLTFNLQDVDVATLAQFAKRAGRLIIESSDELPERGEEDGEDQE